MNHEPELLSSRPWDQLIGTEDDRIPRVMNRAVFDETPDRLLCPTLFAHQLCIWAKRVTDDNPSPPMLPGFEMISVLNRFDTWNLDHIGLADYFFFRPDPPEDMLHVLNSIGAAASVPLFGELAEVVAADGIPQFCEADYDGFDSAQSAINARESQLGSIPRFCELSDGLRRLTTERFDCMTRWCRQHPEECLDAEETVIFNR